MTFNLSIILTESAAAVPERTVAFFAGGQLSYGELDALSDKCAAALADHGLRPGDKVGLQLPNIPQFLIAYFGILKAGCVVVPLNVMLKSAEVEFQLADSGARTLITWEGVLAEAAKGAAAAGLSDIYAVGHPAGAPDAIGFEQLLATPADDFLVVQRDPADTAAVVYTSGTTGRPKGTELTHIGLYMNADIPARAVGVYPSDVVLTVLPLFHVFGLSSIINICVRFGCAMSLVPRWERTVRGITVTVLTPGPADLAAMGVNPMDARRREAVLDSALRTSPASLARPRVLASLHS
jgi:long-chain acyl-CoA synthetase